MIPLKRCWDELDLGLLTTWVEQKGRARRLHRRCSTPPRSAGENADATERSPTVDIGEGLPALRRPRLFAAQPIREQACSRVVVHRTVWAAATLVVGMTYVVGDAWALEVEGRTVNAFLGSADRGTGGELPSARHPALIVTRDAASGTYTVRVPHSRDGVTLALPVEAGERVSVERRQSATGKKLKYQTRTMSLDREKNTLVSFRGLTVGGQSDRPCGQEA